MHTHVVFWVCVIIKRHGVRNCIFIYLTTGRMSDCSGNEAAARLRVVTQQLHPTARMAGATAEGKEVLRTINVGAMLIGTRMQYDSVTIAFRIASSFAPPSGAACALRSPIFVECDQHAPLWVGVCVGRRRGGLAKSTSQTSAELEWRWACDVAFQLVRTGQRMVELSGAVGRALGRQRNRTREIGAVPAAAPWRAFLHLFSSHVG